ncbi:MAG: dockerin type I repeat-containing protein [Clostridiales bacterium]|nr:dockerin type I repeat-containing protein [Clostridiales bacterium]
MKKFIATLTAAVLLCLSVTPAFAADFDSQLWFAESMFREEVDGSYYAYVTYHNLDIPSMYTWSEATINSITELKELVDSTEYTSMEQIEEDREKLDEINRTATVNKSELEFMISVFEYDNNASGYYDDETWSERNEVLEQCKAALTEDDETIHQAYIKARNEFNKLCLYNTTMGDIDNDGNVNIADVTIFQKAVVGTTKLTLSQCYVANVMYTKKPYEKSDLFPNVISVTNLQKFITGYYVVNQFSSRKTMELIANPTLDAYPENRESELFVASDYNHLFYDLRMTEGYGCLII